ncbi:MAG: ABC transporter permease [Armatimonadetes bacterium]|nr:ABC transporter permease [Armatimonadota bacterium]
MRKQTKPTAAPRLFLHKEGLYKALLPFVALLVVILICAFSMHFIVINSKGISVKWAALLDTLLVIGRQATPVILMAMAMTLVIATKGIDLSVGAVAAISGVTSAVLLLAPKPLPLPAIIMFCLGIGVLAGIWNGILVAYLRIQPFIATLILMVAGRGIAQLLPTCKPGETEGAILTLPLNNPHSNPIFGQFCELGNGAFLGLPNRFYLVALVCAVTWFIARKTVWGTYIEAVGSNETASKYCGVNSSMVKVFVYAFSGVCAALAGLLLTAQVASADANTMALRDHNELDVILGVIVGGTAFSGGKFSLFGSLMGALIMRTLIFTVQAAGLNWGYALAMRAITVVIVCLIQSPAFRASVANIFTRRSA